MTDAPSPAVSPARRALHIATLSVFAIAQPLLSLLPQRDVFLHDFEPRWPEIIGLMVLLLVVLPVFCILTDRLLAALTRTRARWARHLVFFGLATLVAGTFARALIDRDSLQEMGLSWAICGAASLSAAGLVLWAYCRLEVVRQLLSAMSLALLLFPVSFVWNIAPALEPRGVVAPLEARPAKHPVPVVMIVFDEFCSLPLQNEDREIDAVRFPNFARLAKLSNWYRNATANHGQTPDALPTILTGVMKPGGNEDPETAPVNLFQLIQATDQYDMAVFEPVTRRCSEDINPQEQDERSTTERLSTLCHVLGAVYPHLVLAKDTPLQLPSIPEAWFGLHILSDRDRGRRRGLFHYSWIMSREIQLRHFLDSLTPRDKPLFAFLHVALPHYPWCFLPNGDHYILEAQSRNAPDGTFNEMWSRNPAVCRQGCERYLLQMGFVDRFIGQLLDRLSDSGQLDKCLLIVTADHGVSFEPGHSRRKPEARTIGDIAAVPLFVKLPGQREGQLFDRNVESIDLLPTIADVMGVELRNPVDGASLLDTDAPERPRKTLHYDGEMTILEPQPLQPLQRLKEFWWQWRPGTAWESWGSTASRPELIDRNVASFQIRQSPDVTLDVYPGRTSSEAERSQFASRYVQGQYVDAEGASYDVVCTLDGRVVGVAPATFLFGQTHQWSLLLPASEAPRDDGDVEIFLWDERQPNELLRFESGQLQFRDKRLLPRSG